MSSWREREERGGRYGDHLTRWTDRDRDTRGRSWERDRSNERSRGPHDRHDRDRYDRERRDRDRDRERHDREERRRSRERYDRSRDRGDRPDRERRRSPRRYDDIPAAPSPPKISSDERPKSRSRTPSSSKEPENMVMSDYDTPSYENKPDDNLTSANASPGDWLCVSCGSYNFKRRTMCFRRNCQGKRSEGVLYGNDPESLSDANSGITKKLLFRRLDALTTEEKILDSIKNRCTKDVLDSIAGITIGRETLTGASKCMAFINFNSISESTAAHTQITALQPPLEIDGREVLVSFYNEPQKTLKTPTQKPKKFGGNYYNYAQYGQYTAEPMSEADRVNAAAAVAQSAINAAQARQMSWTPISVPVFVTSTSQATPNVPIPTGDGKTAYSAPDVRTFLYDETSGYYYDPGTGLYYDGATQYFYNSQINQYMYWDATTSTYIAATQAQQNTDQPKLPSPPEANSNNTISKEPEEKKKKDKEDKVKVAKKIAKDMERWARTLNHKKEIAKSNVVVEQPQEVKPFTVAASKGSADIGFSVLGAGPSVPPSMRTMTSIQPREISPPPVNVDDFLMKKTEPVLENDDGIIDWSKLTCLLCKRRFPSAEILTKHKTMSDLHKQNLAEYRKKTDMLPQSNGYRDRAAERRMKFGEDDAPPMRKRYEPPEIHMPVQSHPPPSVVDTIGGKMLQKMGWSQGRGLGKEEQGRIAPIEAEQRPGLAGLGQKRGIYTPTPGETYRDTVKKLMIARYKEVVGQEDK